MAGGGEAFCLPEEEEEEPKKVAHLLLLTPTLNFSQFFTRRMTAQQACNAPICTQFGCAQSVLMQDSQGRESFTKGTLLSMPDWLLAAQLFTSSEEGL